MRLYTRYTFKNPVSVSTSVLSSYFDCLSSFPGPVYVRELKNSQESKSGEYCDSVSMHNFPTNNFCLQFANSVENFATTSSSSAIC